MATRSKTKKAKTRKQAKAKSGKERRPDGLVIGSDGAKLVDAVCSNDWPPLSGPGGMLV